MEKILASELFNKNKRFDLIYKILYIEHINSDKDIKNYYKSLYLDSIKYFNGFFESSPSKTNSDDFIKSFDDLYVHINSDGFDIETPIPVSKSYQLQDGAHRLSVCYVLNQDVYISKLDENNIYDYTFFKNRKMPETLMDVGALEYVKRNNKAHIVQIAPNVSYKYDKYIENVLNEFGFIYYKKKISLNYNSLIRLKSINYRDDSWCGDDSNGFIGLKNHAANSCGFYKARAYVFVCDNLNCAIKAKKKIRDYLKKGNFPVHITDSNEEAVEIAELLFNKNGIDFIKSTCFKENKHIKYVTEYTKTYCKNNNISFNDFCISSSSILSLYNLRDGKDIDCLFKEPVKYVKDDLISSHISETNYYPDKFDNLIEKHSNYLTVNGIRFLSILNVLKMKIRRHEFPKDYKDIALIIFKKNINLLGYQMQTLIVLSKISVKKLLNR